MKKKNNRRSRNKFAALDPAMNLKIRREEIADLAEYAHTLDDKDRDWLNRFAEEYINADLNHDGKKIHKKDKYKKSINRKNNDRNKCILSKGRACGDMKSLQDMEIEERLTDSLEDQIIDKIDSEEF